MAKRIGASRMGPRFLLGCGIVFTAAAILRVGVWPVDTPVPASIVKDQLRSLVDKGWIPIDTIAPRRRQRVSNGEGYRLQAPMLNSGKAVQMRLIPVRARGINDLNLEVIERNLSGVPPKQTAQLTLDPDQFLIFPSGGGRRVAATCVARGQARSDQEGLVAVLVNVPTSWADRLRTMVGLQQPRDLSCLFTAISFDDAPGGAGDSAQVIEQMWRSVGSDLKEIKL